LLGALSLRGIGWIGTYYDGTKLKFEFVDKNAVEVIKSKYKNEFVWVEDKRIYETYFDFEENHYFCLKAEEQLAKLREWMETNYKKLVDYSNLR